MEKTAYEIQKERIAEIEAAADDLLEKCSTLMLASLNENGYPRICAMGKLHANGFREIYFQTAKRSKINGKVTHFEKSPKASVCYFFEGDSVTLIGNVEIVNDVDVKRQFEARVDRQFFKNGTDDPKFRLLRFRAIEATFWIGGKFRTCKYKP